MQPNPIFFYHIWLCDVSNPDTVTLIIQGYNNDIYLHHTAKSHAFYSHLAPSWMIEVGLVWLGLYICPTNQTYYTTKQKKKIILPHFIGN